MQIASARSIRDRTPFIGRRREQGLLIEDIEAATGLLTITGPSGIGKTRLVRQVAGEVALPFQEGGSVWFCSVSGSQGPVEVEAAVARALGIPKKHGEELARAIANRGKMLLILDNLDTVAAQIPDTLGLWLDRCPELQMMTTSIVPIEMDGAVRFELGPLEAADAVALYLERAHRAWAGKRFSAEDGPAVEELVIRLDRIPLAIELAAARVRVLPPRALLSRFDKRFELLRSGASGRHGSLIEALTLTWELLPEREQTILARASIFEGGFTYEAAVEILGEEGTELEMLDLLDSLRSKALLQVEDSDPPRFLLFESVREFAALELRRSGLERESLQRHGTYFIEKAEDYADRLEGVDAWEANRWLEAERENLVVLLKRSLPDEVEVASRVGVALSPLLILEGHLPSGKELIEDTIQAARRSGDPLLLTRALDCKGTAIAPHGRIQEAQVALDEALALARSSGNREMEGHLLVRLAALSLRKGQVEPAIPLLEIAARIGADEELPLVEVSALMTRGAAEHLRTDIQEAERRYQNSLALCREHGFARREGLALTWLGGIWASQGRFREARRALRDALDRFREAGERAYESNALMSLAGVEYATGDLGRAEEKSLECLELQRRIGNHRGEGIVLGTLGCVALERGEFEVAEGRLSESVGILRDLEDRRFHASVLPFVAVMEARSGRPVEARRSLDEAKAYFREVSDESSLLVTEVLEGALELAEARRLAPAREREAELLVERARGRLEAAPSQPSFFDAGGYGAFRLLEQDLEQWAIGYRSQIPQAPSEGLRVGFQATWFEVPGRERVELRRRVALRRILDALVERRLETPGVGLGPHELFDLGWSGAEIHPDAATRRVYLGIWTLRELGLADLLLNQTDGYLLDPTVPVIRQPE